MQPLKFSFLVKGFEGGDEDGIYLFFLSSWHSVILYKSCNVFLKTCSQIYYDQKKFAKKN